MQERRNSIALAMELRLSCINPSRWHVKLYIAVYPVNYNFIMRNHQVENFLIGFVCQEWFGAKSM